MRNHEYEIPFTYTKLGMLPVTARSHSEAVAKAQEKLKAMSTSDMDDYASYLTDSETVDSDGQYVLDGQLVTPEN